MVEGIYNIKRNLIFTYMCELFGFSSNCEANVVNGLQDFAEHSDRNPHGWGLAYYGNSGAVLKKKAVEARKSPEYYDAIRLARSKVIISHIRHASCGKINEANCHPFYQAFLGKEWVFAHNGHVDGVARHPRTGGGTDSESVFNVLLDNVLIHRNRDNGAAYHGISGGIASLFDDYEFGRQIGLNFVMSDGRTLYAFNHHADKPMYYSSSDGLERSVTVSTQKLDGYAWEYLPTDRLMLVADGNVIALSDRI
jgi:glutamine amidotransferase